MKFWRVEKRPETGKARRSAAVSLQGISKNSVIPANAGIQ